MVVVIVVAVEEEGRWKHGRAGNKAYRILMWLLLLVISSIRQIFQRRVKETNAFSTLRRERLSRVCRSEIIVG